MASQLDQSDFVDTDYQTAKSGYATTSTHTTAQSHTAAAVNRPPTREELDTRVSEAQLRLEELRRAQEELQRERAALEEARRRRVEFQTGREEMSQHLTRGIALIEEAEFNARRDSEQMTHTLTELRDHMSRVQGINEESWTQETWNTELTRALTVIENARNEWNSARLRWALLNGKTDAPTATPKDDERPFSSDRGFAQWCKMGLALTWPVAVAVLLGFGLMLLRR